MIVYEKRGNLMSISDAIQICDVLVTITSLCIEIKKIQNTHNKKDKKHKHKKNGKRAI